MTAEQTSPAAEPGNAASGPVPPATQGLVNLEQQHQDNIRAAAAGQGCLTPEPELEAS
jgi:hypothetical protein